MSSVSPAKAPKQSAVHRRHWQRPRWAAQRKPGRAEAGKRRGLLSILGPGLITGAADDDPSGISTYSVAGASLGYATLWTALLSFPMMAAVQLMCARLGMVTGRGLAGVIRGRYPRWVLWGACLLLVVANLFNIGADLAGMAEVTGMVTISSVLWAPFYTAIIIALLFWTSYRTIARIFKWLTLVLFAYVATAFLVKIDWAAALRATFLPHLTLTRDFMTVLVGILGTTISPYLFFWQASQEVEVERAMGRSLRQRKGATDVELANSRNDVVIGMLYSNLIMYFIILTTAATLHAHGNTHVTSAKEAAEALRPLAGNAAYWLFSLGVIGTGMLGVPVLAGSCAYAITEAAAWRGSLDRKPARARRFYWVIGIAMIVGMGLDFSHVHPVIMLFWSAVVNGVLAPPLILLVVLLTSDPKVMGARVNHPVVRWLGWLTFVAMLGAVAGMLFLG
jgi:NRAMP (natural resistance-associated macrophage protein)-like metal ion transporter